MKRYIQTDRWGIGLVMAGLLWISAAVVQPAQAAYYGLFVGVENYLPAYIPSGNWLTAPANDVHGFRGKLLADTNRWKAARISTLLNGAATETAIKSRLRGKAAALNDGDVFVYYQSSHGRRYSGRSTALCCYSSDFKDTELAHELARFDSGVKIFVIIDACHSAGMFKSGEGWNFADNVLRAYQEEGAKMGDQAKALGWNIAFMTACEYNQTSLEMNNGYSDYTKYLIRVCAKPWEDRDPRNGYYSFWELHSYAKKGTLAEDHGSQVAQHRNYTQLRNWAAVQVKIEAPTPVGPTGSTIARPLFTWDNVDGAEFYQVQVFNNAGRLIMFRKWLRTTAWRPGSNLPDGTYTWRVCGYTYASTRNQGPWSRVLSFTVNPAGAFIRRATLTWGAAPLDLDSWLVTPNGARVGYSNKGSQSSAPYAQLDVDDRVSYGPENISIYHYTPAGRGVYMYYVHNFSGTGSLAGARVSVQSPTSRIQTFTCHGGAGRYWHVFNMSASGTLTSVNQVRATPP